MIIDLNNLDDWENLENLSGTLMIVVTNLPYDGEDYLMWEGRDVNRWIHEFEIEKGEVNSQRYVKYNKDGELTDCISFN